MYHAIGGDRENNNKSASEKEGVKGMKVEAHGRRRRSEKEIARERERAGDR